MGLIIERIEILLLIAAVVSMIARRLKLPYTVGLVVAGLILALIPQTVEINLTKELIFTAFLPPLIFEAAFQMHWKEIRDDFAVTVTLATVGVVASAALVAAGVHYLAGWRWEAAILIGVLLSATDPVSVIATFKEAGVEGRLRMLVEVESLFNDSTVAVLFGVALMAATGGAVTASGAAISFGVTVVGGVVCGLLVGGAVLLLAGRTEDHLVEITFTSVAAYGAFLLAEHFHFSGVLATLTAGILLGNIRHLGAITDRGREEVVAFWEYVGFVANSLIFLLIGMQLTHQRFGAVWLPIGVAIVFVTLGRAVAVYGGCGLFVRSRVRVRMARQHVLFWGGLRGALSLALVLGLPAALPERESIITVTFAVVAFSVIVQGLTVTPLLKKLGEVKSAGSEEVHAD